MEWRRPVGEVIGERLWLTVVVSVAALILTWVLALPIGIYSAVRQYSPGDYVATFIGFIGLAVPNFLLALVLLYAYTAPDYKVFTVAGAEYGSDLARARALQAWLAPRAWVYVELAKSAAFGPPRVKPCVGTEPRPRRLSIPKTYSFQETRHGPSRRQAMACTTTTSSFSLSMARSISIRRRPTVAP